MNRIRQLCTIALFIAVPWMLFAFYYGVSWALNEAILQPDLWLTDNWVDPGAVIAPLLTRWIFLVVWFVPPLLGLIAYAMGARVLLGCRLGDVFEPRTAWGIVMTGVWLSLSAIANIIAASISPMIKSWHNPEGLLPLRFWTQTEDYALVLCGLGFAVLGLIMKEAIKIVRENKGFV